MHDYKNEVDFTVAHVPIDKPSAKAMYSPLHNVKWRAFK